MGKLMEYSLQTGTNPIVALKKYAQLLRDQGYIYQPPNGGSPGQLMDANQTNGVVTSPAVTLHYSSPPEQHAATGMNSGGLKPPRTPAMSARNVGGAAGQGQGDGNNANTSNASPHLASTPASAATQTPNPANASIPSTSGAGASSNVAGGGSAGAGSSASTSSTPMVQPATLKRKAPPGGDATASPTTASAAGGSEQPVQPPPTKRVQRKKSVRH